MAARLQGSFDAIGAFVSGFVETELNSFVLLSEQLGKRLLRPAAMYGTLPYNTGCLAHGYCSAIVLASTPEAAQREWDEVAAACR